MEKKIISIKSSSSLVKSVTFEKAVRVMLASILYILPNHKQDSYYWQTDETAKSVQSDLRRLMIINNVSKLSDLSWKVIYEWVNKLDSQKKDAMINIYDTISDTHFDASEREAHRISFNVSFLKRYLLPQ